MKNQGGEKIELPIAIILFVVVGLLAGFILTPGDITKKAISVSSFLNEYGSELIVIISVILFNLLIIFGSLLSIFRVGRLGSKIEGFYINQNGPRSYAKIILFWLILTTLLHLINTQSGLLVSIEILDKNLSVSKAIGLEKVLSVSLYSLISMTLTFLLALILNLKSYFQENRLMSSSGEINQLVLGSCHERS